MMSGPLLRAGLFKGRFLTGACLSLAACTIVEIPYHITQGCGENRAQVPAPSDPRESHQSREWPSHHPQGKRPGSFPTRSLARHRASASLTSAQGRQNCRDSLIRGLRRCRSRSYTSGPASPDDGVPLFLPVSLLVLFPFPPLPVSVQLCVGYAVVTWRNPAPARRQ